MRQGRKLRHLDLAEALTTRNARFFGFSSVTSLRLWDKREPQNRGVHFRGETWCMRRTISIWTMAAAALAGCRGSDAPPSPTFAPVFPPITGQLMSLSSPKLVDLDRDGALDIVYGSGVDRLRPQNGVWRFSDDPPVPGYVTAVSGATNAILWRAPHTGAAYTTPRFPDLNRDGVPDVVMGGREGAFAGFSGTDGSVLWRTPPEEVAETPEPYNFSTPALIGDVDGDGVTELLVTYGGNATRLPGDPRDPGFVAVISGATGSVLAAHATPDGAETYASPVVYERADGTQWLVFGTGGETIGGAAFRAPVASLLDGTFPQRVERLTSTGEKGVMAPVTIVELTGDGEPDIAVSTFDGRLIVVDGASGKTLWERRGKNEESYHPAAVARIARNGRIGLLISRAIGVFPNYIGSAHRLYDARDGTLLYVYKSEIFPAGAPLAVDITGDDIEELFFFGDPGRIHIYHAPSKQLIIHDVEANFSATPLIADPRRTGSLELIGVSWWNVSRRPGLADWRDLRSQLLRMRLDADSPEFRSWPGYMGPGTDGRYRPPEAAGRD